MDERRHHDDWRRGREEWEGRREPGGERWRGGENRSFRRAYGEGEFERGGRREGGYPEGGHRSHMEEHRGGSDWSGREAQGYGSYGGGANRERSRGWEEPERRGWSGGRERVGDLMHRGAEVLNPNMSIRDAARRMRADNLGAYPVGERDRLVGMVTDRDIVVRAVAMDRNPGATTVRDVMSEHVFYCFEDDAAEDAAELMARHQVRRIPVLNRDKRLVGVLAMADLGRREPHAAERALMGVSEPTDSPRRWS